MAAMDAPLLAGSDRDGGDGYQTEIRPRSNSTTSTVSMESLTNVRSSTVCGKVIAIMPCVHVNEDMHVDGQATFG
jgi:hypothetical protein